MCESLQPLCHPLQECRVISYQVSSAVLTGLDGNNTLLREIYTVSSATNE